MSQRVVSHVLRLAPRPAQAAAPVGAGKTTPRPEVSSPTGVGVGPEDPADGLDGLDLRAYSLMKHGHLPSVYALADRLTADLLAADARLLDPQLRITLPVAYFAVLPACGHLAARVAQGLAAARSDGAAEVRVVRLAKSAVTTIDYAASSADERRSQMLSLSFSLDEPVDGDLVVLVDDVRITGLAEEAAVAALAAQAQPLDIITAYVAAAAPELATDPSVEHALNHSFVSSPLDLLPAIEAGEFALTIRYLKWALGSPDAAQLLRAVPEVLAREMDRGAAASGLWGRPEFEDAHAVLQQRLGAGSHA